jgi:hypothetical protein
MPSDLIGGYLTLDLNPPMKWADFRFNAWVAETMLTKLCTVSTFKFIIKGGKIILATPLTPGFELLKWRFKIQYKI